MSSSFLSFFLFLLLSHFSSTFINVVFTYPLLSPLIFIFHSSLSIYILPPSLITLPSFLSSFIFSLSSLSSPLPLSLLLSYLCKYFLSFLFSLSIPTVIFSLSLSSSLPPSFSPFLLYFYEARTWPGSLAIEVQLCDLYIVSLRERDRKGDFTFERV